MRLPAASLALVVLLAAPSVLRAQTARQELSDSTRIYVTASKTVRVVPDRVTLWATVEGAAESAADASKRASQKVEAVMAAVRALGARGESPVAVPFGISPVVNNMGAYPQVPVPLPYVARYAVRIRPARVDQLQEVAAAAIAAGALSTAAPAFESGVVDSVRRASTAEVLRQARLEAEAIAEGLGGRVGPLLDVTVNAPPSFGGFQNSSLSFSNRFDSGQMPLPELVITSSVSVRYRLLR